MWIAIKLFFNEKVFTATGIFISIFLAIIAIFIFSNSNVILSKFGFETTTTLKAELTRTQEELKRAKEINDNLNNTIETLKSANKDKIDSVIGFYKEKEAAKDAIIIISKKKEVRDRETIKNLEQKTTKTETTITIPIAEYNKLSESNIDTLNEVYDSFFKDMKVSSETTTVTSLSTT